MKTITLKSKTELGDPHPYWHYFEVTVSLERGTWYCQDHMLSRVGITSGSTAEDALNAYKKRYGARELWEGITRGARHEH
jgi:hypothetical protein